MGVPNFLSTWPNQSTGRLLEHLEGGPAAAVAVTVGVSGLQS